MNVPWSVLAQAEITSQRFVRWVWVWYAIIVLGSILLATVGGRLLGYWQGVPHSPRARRLAESVRRRYPLRDRGRPGGRI